MAEKRDNDRVGFFDLPPEIRNHIYAYCLTIKGDLEVRVKGRSKGLRTIVHTSAVETETSPHLLLTCRAVNTEALEVFYGANTFYLSRLPAETLSAMGPNIVYLRQVKFGKACGIRQQTAALRLLKQCKDLDSVVNCHANFGHFVRDMHKKRKGTARKQVWEVLQTEWGRDKILCPTFTKDRLMTWMNLSD